jgi:hypothetical protein
MKELLKEDRRWGVHDMNATEVRAEIDRRRAQRKQWFTLAGIIIASLAVIAAFANLVVHLK